MSDPIPEGNPIKGMSKKVGPLPLYAYALIVVGGAYGVYWWKNRVGVATPETPSTTGVGSGMSSAGPAPGTGTYNGVVGGQTNATPAAQTNAQWAKKVADGMIATGTPPADANNAVAAYLVGGKLSPVQQAIITIALQVYGNPPEGVIAVNVEDKKPFFWQFQRNDATGAIFGVTQDHQSVPLTYEDWVGLGAPQQNLVHYTAGDGSNADQPAEFYKFLAPPGGHKYTVKAGDTWESIAQSFYGTQDGSAIRDANSGRELTPGAVLTIPEK